MTPDVTLEKGLKIMPNIATIYLNGLLIVKVSNIFKLLIFCVENAQYNINRFISIPTNYEGRKKNYF
jgi:hypothetical protein